MNTNFEKNLVQDEYEQLSISTERYKNLISLMNKVYGFTSFRQKQYQIIDTLLNGLDVCAILPTGHGKSLTFQLPSLYTLRPTIVVSPLISLMNDQRISLESKGIPSCCYNHEVKDKITLRKQILNGEYLFIYMAPETLVNSSDFLLEFHKNYNIGLFAIDEAHCISSYGFDFRPDYRKIAFLKILFPTVPILALTATATEMVAGDICSVMKLNTCNMEGMYSIIKTSFNRPNLFLESKKTLDHSKAILEKIQEFYKNPLNEGRAVIVYCILVNDTESLKTYLNKSGISTVNYHAKMSSEEKENSFKLWSSGSSFVMAATIAFGMGIDKSNVGLIIHKGIPKAIEGYYQEIGRAGRDGKQSYCSLFWNESDFVKQTNLLMTSEDNEYRTRGLTLLNTVRNYVNDENSCRRKFILSYFGEHLETETNNINDFCCDNCLKSKQTKEKSSRIINTNDLLFLEIVAYMKDFYGKNFGRNAFIKTLMGSKSKELDKRLVKSKYYGKGSSLKTSDWEKISNDLLMEGLIEQISVQYGKRILPVLEINDKGRSVLELKNKMENNK